MDITFLLGYVHCSAWQPISTQIFFLIFSSVSFFHIHTFHSCKSDMHFQSCYAVYCVPQLLTLHLWIYFNLFVAITFVQQSCVFLDLYIVISPIVCTLMHPSISPVISFRFLKVHRFLSAFTQMTLAHHSTPFLIAGSNVWSSSVMSLVKKYTWQSVAIFWVTLQISDRILTNCCNFQHRRLQMLKI